MHPRKGLRKGAAIRDDAKVSKFMQLWITQALSLINQYDCEDVEVNNYCV